MDVSFVPISSSYKLFSAKLVAGPTKTTEQGETTLMHAKVILDIVYIPAPVYSPESPTDLIIRGLSQTQPIPLLQGKLPTKPHSTIYF